MRENKKILSWSLFGHQIYLLVETLETLSYIVLYIRLLFPEKICPAPGPVENAIQSGEYKYGSTVVYTCIKGYYMSAGEHGIICKDGAWQGTKPTCSGSTKCSFPSTTL